MRHLMRLFRFLLQIQGAVVVGATAVPDADAVEVQIRRHGNALPRCPTCGRVMGGTHHPVTVRWRHLDLMRRKTFLVATIREARCPVHGRRQEQVPWAAPRAQCTHDLDRAIARTVQVANKTVTSEFFRLAWRTVGRVVKRVVDRHLPKDLLDDLDHIGVDETSYKRGHHYLTVVSCLKTSRVVWVGEGKSAETFGKFFDALGPERRARIKVIAMDMSAAFIKAARTACPAAEIVFDRFHVVQLMLQAVDEIRRDEARRMKKEERKALKGLRFAFFRNPKHLKERDLAAIAAVKKANDKLYRAYLLRVDFEQFWDITDEREAAHFLYRWAQAAERSKLAPLVRFAHTLVDYLFEIVGFVRHGGLTNAVLEGTNNKIKLLIHKAFGFRSVEALMATVHLCCSGIELTF